MIIYRQSFLIQTSLNKYFIDSLQRQKNMKSVCGINVLVQSSSDTTMKAWIVSIIKFGRGICPIKINDELYGSNHDLEQRERT